MIDWAEPKNFREWSRRVLALRPVLLALLVSSVIILEMRFDWVERALGAYLATTNSARPESGAIWEKGRRTLTAQKTLEKIVTDRQISEREARNAATFSQIAANLPTGQGVMLSADRFRQLYLELSGSDAQEIISALDLLRINGEGRWRRTYFEKRERNLVVYLLDAENRVLRRLDIPAGVLAQIDRQAPVAAEKLEDLIKFKNRIYPADRFFDAMDSFPEDIRRNMLLHPETLLKQSGRIARVGISDEAVSGFIELGFEIVNGDRRVVVLDEGHEWAVWRLRSYLEGKDASARTFNEFLENRTPK
jgi:hypothetical protein